MFNLAKGRKVIVVCADGVTRTATYTGEPDTFFSCPAKVYSKGKTVCGFAWSHSDGHTAFTGQGVNQACVGLWPEQQVTEG